MQYVTKFNILIIVSGKKKVTDNRSLVCVVETTPVILKIV